MSNEIAVPYEALATASIQASIELEFKNKLSENNITAPQAVVGTISTHIANRTLGTYESQLSDQIKSFKYSPETPEEAKPAETKALDVINDLKSSVDNLRNWFENCFKKTDDRLKELAIQILNESKRLNVEVEQYLVTLRKHLFSWVLENSAIGSFSLSGPNGTIVFSPTKISSKGSFGYEPLGASVSSLEGIIGALKLLPKLSIEVDVDYQPPQTTPPKPN